MIITSFYFGEINTFLCSSSRLPALMTIGMLTTVRTINVRWGKDTAKSSLLLLLENILNQKQNPTGENPNFHSYSNSIIQIKLPPMLALIKIKCRKKQPQT